ncbi:unnamed protein product [Paramecium pentaurelia]|uniref:Uncharacterized protein n=1 Tax=Paramecium pentaurelia TaxID=43138 RepID=A0A8S1SVS4_9CILI|nr:unnamed protein product [Paramecium pentaurelia]
MSQQNNKTLNNSYSVSLHQSKQTFNKKNISKVDIETPLEDPKSQLISSKPRSEYQIKKFSIDDRNKITNFLNAIDDYIKQLNENSDCHTVTSDSQSKLENMLILKYNIIQKQQEQLKIKYKKLQQNYAVENQENQTLKNKLFDLHNQLQELKKKNYIQQLILDKIEIEISIFIKFLYKRKTEV